MNFHLRQHIAAAPGELAQAFAAADFYAARADLPKLGQPEVLDRQADGDVVRLRIRYRFTGELSAAARAVLDPAKLSWVEEATHDLAAQRVTFRMVPDHYRDRLRAAGSYWFEPDGDGARRIADGEVVVRMPLVARAVERAIVSGIEEHLEGEVPVVEEFLRGR